MDLYRIVDWANHFENTRTRTMKIMRWVPLPNKHDGDGYTELLDHPKGPLHYACWVVITQVASKCHPRGTLLRGTYQAHNSTSLSRLTRIPATAFDSAIPRLLEIGWLELLTVEQATEVLASIGVAAPSHDPHTTLTPSCQDDAPEGKGIEGKGREGNRREGKASPELKNNSKPDTAEGVVLEFPTVGDGPTTWSPTQAKIDEWIAAFPGVNVLAQCLVALQWCRDNETKRKTARGMPRFLGGWLAKEQNQGRRSPAASSEKQHKCLPPTVEDLKTWRP